MLGEQQPKINTPELTVIKNDHPQETGGVFLPDTVNGIESIKEIGKPERSIHGMIQASEVVMSDGTIYKVKTSRPTNPCSDTAVAFTTAWFTRSDGFNGLSLEKYMEHGWPGILIGPEGELFNKNLSLKDRVSLLGNISLLNSASNMDIILDSVLPEEGLRPKEKILDGKSRSSMTAFGINGVVFADLTAPCFPNKCSVVEGLKILPKVPNELKELGEGLGEYTVYELIKLAREAAKIDINFALHAIATARTLFNGDTGKLVALGDKSTHRLITLFEDDPGSQNDQWPNTLQDHHNTRISLQKGGHLTIPKKAIAMGKLARLNSIRDQRGKDGSFKNVDWDEVCGATSLKPRQRRSLISIPRRTPKAA